MSGTRHNRRSRGSLAAPLIWLLIALAFTLLLKSNTLSGTWPLALAPQPAIHA